MPATVALTIDFDFAKEACGAAVPAFVVFELPAAAVVAATVVLFTVVPPAAVVPDALVVPDAAAVVAATVVLFAVVPPAAVVPDAAVVAAEVGAVINPTMNAMKTTARAIARPRRCLGKVRALYFCVRSE
eukprot:TRINITY_DN517_c0_g1_i1.p2 TRINITY_DN517_c0_g1~~TRINITY_DN517_c0_g1_i1.p2  ORF type:complete len:130 (+),score=23.29 TRINITY_DN517_c0_g1_i1:228-617(+)